MRRPHLSPHLARTSPHLARTSPPPAPPYNPPGRCGASPEVRPPSPWAGAEGDVLQDLARRVERLAPSHRDPHRFFEDRSEIAAELRWLARTPCAKCFQSGARQRYGNAYE